LFEYTNVLAGYAMTGDWLRRYTVRTNQRHSLYDLRQTHRRTLTQRAPWN